MNNDEFFQIIKSMDGSTLVIKATETTVERISYNIQCLNRFRDLLKRVKAYKDKNYDSEDTIAINNILNENINPEEKGKIMSYISLSMEILDRFYRNSKMDIKLSNPRGADGVLIIIDSHVIRKVRVIPLEYIPIPITILGNHKIIDRHMFAQIC